MVEQRNHNPSVVGSNPAAAIPASQVPIKYGKFVSELDVVDEVDMMNKMDFMDRAKNL